MLGIFSEVLARIQYRWSAGFAASNLHQAVSRIRKVSPIQLPSSPRDPCFGVSVFLKWQESPQSNWGVDGAPAECVSPAVSQGQRQKKLHEKSTDLEGPGVGVPVTDSDIGTGTLEVTFPDHRGSQAL